METFPVGVAFAGFLLGLSLILAIGAQNAFVLRQGAAVSDRVEGSGARTRGGGDAIQCGGVGREGDTDRSGTYSAL